MILVNRQLADTSDFYRHQLIRDVLKALDTEQTVEIRALTLFERGVLGLPPDVVRLVNAARRVAFEDDSFAAMAALAAACRAFASVPWEDDPNGPVPEAA
jgi:hypothetical protein